MLASIDGGILPVGSQADDLEAFQSNLLYMKIWRETGLAKLDACCEYLFDLLDRDESIRVLFFAHHQQILDGIEKFLWEKVRKYPAFDARKSSSFELMEPLLL